MTYCIAIRKIFHPRPGAVRTFEEACNMAEYCGYFLLNWNGLIFTKCSENSWMKIDMKITDLEIT